MHFPLKRYLSLLTITLLANMVTAQSKVGNDQLYAEFESDDFEICNSAINPSSRRIPVKVKIVNNTGEQIRITTYGDTYYDEEGNVTKGEYTYPPIPAAMTQGTIEVYLPMPYGTQDTYEIQLKTIYVGAEGNPQLYNELSDILRVTVYNTPTPKLLTTDRLCALDTIVIAENVTGDKYFWDIKPLNDAQLSVEPTEGSRIHVTANKEANIAIDLVQSRGPECKSPILHANARMFTTAKTKLMVDTILICPQINDEAFNFDATLNISGDYPAFKAVLNNGMSFPNLVNGNNTLSVKQKNALDLRVVYVEDLNGCHSDPSNQSGTIEVIDRTPIATFPTDTAYLTTSRDNRQLTIAVDNYTNGNVTEWKLAEEYEDFNNPFAFHISNAHNGSARITPTIIGTYKINYTETNSDGSGMECTINRSQILVISMDINVPDAFSPNGDGKNDVLLVEGLAPENEVYVFDRQGKKVFEAINYRNNWSPSPDELADGFYVCIVKSAGKTFKHSLIIKRSTF